MKILLIKIFTEVVKEEKGVNREIVQDPVIAVSVKRSVKSVTIGNLIHVLDQKVTQDVHHHVRKHPLRNEVDQVVQPNEN